MNYTLIIALLFFVIIICSILYRRIMKIFLYLNFKISVLQKLLLKKDYDEKNDNMNFHPEEDDPDFLKVKFAEDKRIDKIIKKKFNWAIDDALGDDHEYKKTIDAIKYGSKIGIFDTINEMYQVFDANAIIDRFNKKFNKKIDKKEA